VSTTSSEVIFINYAESQNIRKPNNLKVFWRKKTKGPIQKIKKSAIKVTYV